MNKEIDSRKIDSERDRNIFIVRSLIISEIHDPVMSGKNMRKLLDLHDEILGGNFQQKSGGGE